MILTRMFLRFARVYVWMYLDTFKRVFGYGYDEMFVATYPLELFFFL